MVFDDDVLDFLEDRGVSEDEAADMLRRAARVTCPEGNRRFHNYVFQVDGEVVNAVTCLETHQSSVTIALPTTGPGEFIAWEDHEACGGMGCLGCKHEGQHPVVRNYPKGQTAR